MLCTRIPPIPNAIKSRQTLGYRSAFRTFKDAVWYRIQGLLGSGGEEWVIRVIAVTGCGKEGDAQEIFGVNRIFNLTTDGVELSSRIPAIAQFLRSFHLVGISFLYMLSTGRPYHFLLASSEKSDWNARVEFFQKNRSRRYVTVNVKATRPREDTRGADAMACSEKNQPCETTYALHSGWLPKQGATTEYHASTVILTVRRKRLRRKM